MLALARVVDAHALAVERHAGYGVIEATESALADALAAYRAAREGGA